MLLVLKRKRVDKDSLKSSMSSKWTFIILFVKFPLLANAIFGGKAVEEPYLYPWMVKLNINFGKYGNSKKKDN